MSSRARSLAVATVGALALACGPVAPAASEQGPAPQWFTAWSTSQQSLGNTAMTDATVRLMARITAGGDSIRIRLDNTYGTGPLVIGAVTVGVPVRGATLAPGSTRAVTFDGESRVTIPPDESVQSDPISISVIARQDLAVSLFIPETDVRTSQHNGARITSYLTENGGGDRTSDESSDGFTLTTTSMFWLKSIDVLSDSVTGTIVAFGDSITDGSCSTTDGHDRWQDWLALRLHLDAGASGIHKTVINEGIGGNTVTSDVQPPPASTPGVDRLERDVLSHAGVTHVVLFMGTKRYPARGDGRPGHCGNGGDRRARASAWCKGPRHDDHPETQQGADGYKQRLGPNKDGCPERGERLDPRHRPPRRGPRFRPDRP